MENIDRLNEDEKNDRYLESDVNPDCDACHGTGYIKGEPCEWCYDLNNRDKLR